MFITCLIDSSVYGTNSLNENKKVVIDIDPNDEVENVKVLITLKLTEIDPAGLLVFYRNKKLPDNIKVIKLNLSQDDYLVIKRGSSGFCSLI